MKFGRALVLTRTPRRTLAQPRQDNDLVPKFTKSYILAAEKLGTFVNTAASSFSTGGGAEAP